MIKFNKLISSLLILTAFSFSSDLGTIVGFWTVNTPNGVKLMLQFRKDGTFNASTFEGKMLADGKYRLTNDTLFMGGGACGAGYWGKYKIIFYGNDSLTEHLIDDSCSIRKNQQDNLTAKRVRD